MPNIRPLDFIAKKWVTNAGRSGNNYKLGVESPRRSWSEATKAADQARKDGLAAADARNAFSLGVEAAGDAKWKDRATKLGVARYPAGVQIAEPAFRSGFSESHSVIQGVNLGPRGPKGAPQNYDRSKAIGEALHNAKVGA